MAQYLKTELYELIKKDERIFDFIQKNSVDGLWYWDLEKTENKWMNPRFWETLGYDSKTIPNRANAWQSIMNADDYKAAREDFKKHSADPDYFYDQEVRYKHKNGTTIWMRCHALAIQNEKNKPARMFGTAREITREKQASHKLRESEEKFRHIFEQSPLAIQLYNSDGDLLEVNQQTLDLFGIEDTTQLSKYNFWDHQDLTPEHIKKLKANKPVMVASNFDFELARANNIIDSKHSGEIFLDMYVAPIITQDNVHSYLVQIVETSAKKLAKEELQNQLNLFKTVIDTVPARIFWKDVNSVYLGCNANFLRDAGKTSDDEVIGKTDDEMSWKEHAELYRADDRKIMQSGVSKRHYEEPFIGIDGKEIIWSTSKLPLKNARGETFGVVAISENVTAEKIAAKKIKESERKFRGIFEHSNIGIVIANDRGYILDVNEGFLAITDYDRDEFVGLNYEAITDAHDLANEKVLFAELIDGKRDSYRIEKRLICKNGNRVWLDTTINAIRDSRNEIENLIVLVVDITEKKKSTESMKVFFEQPMNLHVIASIDGTMIHVNSGCKNLLGYTRKELEGTSFLKLVHPDDLPATLNEVKALENGKKTFNFENRYRHKQGKYITLAWSAIANASSHLIHAIAKDISEEKAYHEALLLSEENYKALSENANHVIITHNFKGEITYANQYTLDLLGLTKEQILGVNIAQFVTDADELRKLNERKTELEKGNYKVHHFDLVIPLPSGELHYLDVIGSPITKHNKIDSVLITAYDITHRKIAEAKIKEQAEAYEALNEELRQTNDELLTSIRREEKINEQFSMAMKASSEGLWDWNVITGNVYYSPAWKHMLGYKENELENTLLIWEKVTHPEDLPATYEMIDKLVNRSIDKLDVEFRMQHKKGHWLIVSSRGKAFFDAEGKAVRIVGTDIDITQKKQDEIRLKENEEKLSLAINSSPLGIAFCDFEGNLNSVNIAFQKMLGYEKEELERMNFFDFTHPDYIPENRTLMQTLASTQKTGFLFEKQYIRKDGSIIDVRIHSGTIQDKQGKPLFAMAFVEDITELRKTVNDLKLAKEKAEEANALKTQFLHNMSHEIRTPMNGIIGFSDLLSSTTEQTEQQKNFTSIIQNSSTQLLRIIDDILEISTLETKQLTIQESEFDVNQFIMELFAIYDLKSKERNLPLYVKKDLPAENGLIISDKAKIHKIISNLLDNAFKFTSAGKIEFGYRIEYPNIVFFVKDTGIGISVDKQTRIFERFSQESSQTAQEFGGLGLGLSIAKENTELLNGTISVKSTKGVGSAFYVEIPYKATKEIHSTAVATMIPDEDASNIIQVLIAEDEEVNYLFLEAILENIADLPIKLHHVINGEEAVNMCLNNDDIDIVLMDIKMPVMNGYQASKKIKAIKPDLPIIAQTAYSTSREKQMALEHGCDDFISKPIKKQKLLELMLKHLQQQ